MNRDTLKKAIRTIPDFPKPGILFRDITPLLLDPALLRYTVDEFARVPEGPVDFVVSVESRGFILGSALAYALNAGFVPVRKEGKLPHKKHRESYHLEYGEACIEIHQEGITSGARIVVIDDVLATGGTMEATLKLVKKLGADVVGVYFLIELTALGGRGKLTGYPIHPLLTF